MAYDKSLADRVRLALLARQGFEEKKMFGGLCFMLHGHMACGVLRDHLIVRVGLKLYGEALDKPHAGVFDLTGRPMKGWVRIEPGGWRPQGTLEAWLGLGVAHALSLPPKTGGRKGKKGAVLP